MKTKTVYVATATVYLTDKRGNVKTLPVGTEISAREFADLNVARQAKFTRVEKSVGRARFAGGTVTDLPVVGGVVKTEFRPGEYNLLPVMVHDLVNEVESLWAAAYPEIPFPGVCVGQYKGGDHHLAWFINGGGLPASATPMFTTSNHLCGLRSKADRVAHPQPYPYHTASLLKTAERLRSGRPVFASTEQAIDRLLAA